MRISSSNTGVLRQRPQVAHKSTSLGLLSGTASRHPHPVKTENADSDNAGSVEDKLTLSSIGDDEVSGPSYASIAGRAAIGAAIGALPVVRESFALWSLSEGSNNDDTWALASGMGTILAPVAISMLGNSPALGLAAGIGLSALHVSRKYYLNAQAESLS